MKYLGKTSLVGLLALMLFFFPCEVRPKVLLSYDPIIIVQEGQALAPIIIYENAPPRTLACAKELADYIQKISGAKPELIVGGPDQIPKGAIWIGHHPALNELFPDTDFTFKHPEEIIIKSSGQHLVIAGRDRWIPGGMTRPGRKKTVEGVQQEYGTCNAIYTFLQDYLDVRWLGPGEVWEDIPTKRTIILEAFEHRYYPQFRARDGALRYITLGENRSSPEEQDWARRQRLQYSSLSIDGGHAFTDWWEKYHADHPDYFALLPNGKRVPTDDPRKVKLCMSNSAVWQQWMQEVEAQLKANPAQVVFSASPNDGWNRGHCTCDNCQAWDAVPMNGPNPNLADRNLKFANHLGELLKNKYPSKDYYVSISAYGYSRRVPVETRSNDNVIVSSVHQFYMRPKELYPGIANAKKEFIDWTEKTDHIVWRPGLPNLAGHQQGMPDIDFQVLYDNIQFVAEHGAEGLFVDTHWDHWSTQGPLYYLLSQLLWDPDQDLGTIMDDFLARAYGPAENEMRQYWTLMEDTRTKLLQKYPSNAMLFAHTVYNQAWVQQAKGLLQKALPKVKGQGKYEDRIEFNAFGLDMVDRMMRLRSLRHQFEIGKGSEADKKQNDTIWGEINAARAESPPDAFNYRYVLRSPGQSRMRMLHYKYKLDKKSARALKKMMATEGH